MIGAAIIGSRRARLIFRGVIGSFLIACAGCSSLFHSETSSGSAAGSGEFSTRNQGYSLLYELVSKEKDVAKILLIKKEKSDVHAVITAIAATSRDATKKLEEFAKADRSLRLKTRDLPLVEEQTRAAIESAQGKELLRSSKRKFELELLLTQIDGLDYGSHLAAVLEKQESNPARRQYLNQLSRQLEALYLQVFNLISSRYVREF